MFSKLGASTWHNSSRFETNHVQLRDRRYVLDKQRHSSSASRIVNT